MKQLLIRAWSVVLGFAALAVAPSAFAIVTGAVWTTDVGGTVDRNIYAAKCDVYLNGGPKNEQQTALIDGTYYWQVTDPSGGLVLSTQPGGLRTLTVSGGRVTAPIKLCEFRDSPNGEYKVWAVLTGTPDCVVTVNTVMDDTNTPADTLSTADEDGKSVSLTSCSKTDNFRIEAGPSCGGENQPPCACDSDPPPLCGCDGNLCSTPFDPAIDVFKTATGLYDLDWSWSLAKTGCAVVNGTALSPCQTKFNQVGGTVTFQYTLTLTPGTPVRTNNEVVGGIIVVATPGGDILGHPVPVTGITLEDNIAYGFPLTKDETATCVIDGEWTNYPDTPMNIAPGTVPPSFSGTKVFAYHCSYTSLGPANETGETNQAILRANSPATAPNGGNEAEALAPFTFAKDQDIDGCVTVKDAFDGGTAVDKGTVCWNDTVKTITYTRDIPVPATGCQTVNNVASSSLTLDAPAQVTVCGPVKTGGLTMGFWQNKNGQDIITKYCMGSPTTLYDFLRAYKPFQDLNKTACKDIAAYVSGIIKLASASGAAMNAMLKGQMLATALDVYFGNGPGGNWIGAPVGVVLGNQAIDLTKICKNIATCSIYEDTSAAFGGTIAVPVTQLTVSQLLTYAGLQCTVVGCTTSGWYLQVKTMQELAKDTFDAINNQKAFAP